MSMNFGRELSLLRIRLTEAGSPQAAADRKAELASAAAFLGAAPGEIEAAAKDLVATYPQMGRAQMTAFVRTLWQSNVHDLQAVGAHILADRASLLEVHDFAFLEGLIKKCDAEPLAAMLAGDVLGVVATKNKKLWKDLRRIAGHADANMRRAAVRACREPLLADADGFSRFEQLVEPLFAAAEADVLDVVDEVLAAVAHVHEEGVRALAERHERAIPAARPARAAKKTTKKKATKKKAAKKRS